MKLVWGSHTIAVHSPIPCTWRPPTPKLAAMFVPNGRRFHYEWLPSLLEVAAILRLMAACKVVKVVGYSFKGCFKIPSNEVILQPDNKPRRSQYVHTSKFFFLCSDAAVGASSKVYCVRLLRQLVWVILWICDNRRAVTLQNSHLRPHLRSEMQNLTLVLIRNAEVCYLASKSSRLVR